MKKTLLFFAFLASSIILSDTTILAQGCVAIRSVGASCSSNGTNSNFLDKGQWQVSTSFRYFRSYKHFKGDVEQKDRVAKGTEVINKSSSLDFTITYAYSKRLNFNLIVPFVYNDRSSLYEHGLVNGVNKYNQRYSTQSKGLGDIRLSASYWLFDHEKNKNGNLAVGLGIKSNSGNYNAKDEWHNVGTDGASEMRTVDQSIQPGDGGWGVTLEIQGYRKLVNNLYVYGNAFYLLNPRETNGTRTYRETLSPVLYNETIMSVPDQYLARVGFTYITPVKGLSASLGSRVEGIPVYDIIGGSQGFRRPGYIVSVEPAVSYMRGKSVFNLNVPIALYRNRTQSVTDKDAVPPRTGDAAFADYLISVGYSYRFAK